MIVNSSTTLTYIPKVENLAMKGRIYANKGGYIVRFGRGISKWFKHEQQAERFLNGLRYENDKGTYDERDYQKDRPMAFIHLAEQYAELKKKKLKPRSFKNVDNYMTKAMQAWGYSNIKSIGYAEIEDFLYSQNVSDKTRANMKSCLHDFFTWLRKRKIINLQNFPEFPEIKFELGWRNIVDHQTQQRIIEEVYNISYHINPKIWIGIKWLSVYIGMRPGEMLNLKEKYIDTGIGSLIIPHPKEKESKIIYLLDDDVEILKQMPRGLPALYFFRHNTGKGGVKKGSKFGPRYLYKWWKKACDNLGVEGIDLYGGTRHSTARALSEVLTPEQIKSGTMHKTNKAFERYFQRTAVDAKMVYQAVKNLQLTYNNGEVIKIDKLLK